MSDIRAIVKQMTLEEKAALCTGANNWATVPLDRLGVPVFTMSDGPHGLRHVADPDLLASQPFPATCFPTASTLGSTWNNELVNAVGQAIAEECITQGVDVILGPGVNMKRTPLCGRNFEYFSEDPYLAGEMAASIIEGVQSKGVGTSLKHFATNNQEYHRFSASSMVDERTLREIYLPAFEKAVKRGKPWTVMCSYNRLNGTYASENHHLLVDILKNEWGFEGLVVSDWGAVHDRVAALKGGLDLEMPGPRPARVQAVVDAVQAGELEESILDESVFRILNIVFMAASPEKKSGFDARSHHNLAKQAACEGIVLLKNNGILPLKARKHIAVIGLAAKEPYYQGSGSSKVNPIILDNPISELKRAAGEAELSFSQGYVSDEGIQQDLIDDAVQIALAADVALIYIGMAQIADNEGNDRPGIDLTPQQVALIQAVAHAQPSTIVILNNGSAVAMSEWIDGVAAVLEGWASGQASGSAIADILFGWVNPSGKLSESFPLKLNDTPAYLNYPGENDEVRYGEGIFIGYRYYDEKEINVLFPFGYGLSYTNFAYSNSKVSARTFRDTDGLMVSVDVTNTGERAGKEVVQFYVHDHMASLARPPKELKGFAKVELQPGETKTVTVQLNLRAFAFYHPGYGKWITEDGKFDILIGASATDIRCTEKVTLQSTIKQPSLLNRFSTVREWLEDPCGKVVFDPIYEMITSQMKAMFGAEGHNEDAADTEILGLMDMPLLSIFEFSQKDMPAPAEQMIDLMLEQVHTAS